MNSNSSPIPHFGGNLFPLRSRNIAVLSMFLKYNVGEGEAFDRWWSEKTAGYRNVNGTELPRFRFPGAYPATARPSTKFSRDAFIALYPINPYEPVGEMATNLVLEAKQDKTLPTLHILPGEQLVRPIPVTLGRLVTLESKGFLNLKALETMLALSVGCDLNGNFEENLTEVTNLCCSAIIEADNRYKNGLEDGSVKPVEWTIDSWQQNLASKD